MALGVFKGVFPKQSDKYSVLCTLLKIYVSFSNIMAADREHWRMPRHAQSTSVTFWISRQGV